MKKLLKMLLSFTTAVLIAVPVLAFPDVSDDHWAAKQIKELTEKSVIVGYPDGTFQPDENVTRAEFASVFSRILYADKYNVD